MTQPGNRPGHWFDFEEFASMTGFHAGLRDLEEKGEVRWTNAATDLHTGGIHALRYRVSKDEQGAPVIALQHWLHWPGGKPQAADSEPQILTLKTETRRDENGMLQIRPTGLELMGKPWGNAEDMIRAMHVLQETASEIHNNNLKNTQGGGDPAFSRLQRRVKQTKQRDEIPSLYDITQRAGFRHTFKLPGMFFNGEFDFKPANGGKAEAPVYPVQLLLPMLGIEDEWNAHDGKPFSHTFSMPNADGMGYEGVRYQVTPGEDGFSLSCHLRNSTPGGGREQTDLYRMTFTRATDAGIVPTQYRLSALEMLGNSPDITDHKGVARAIRAMKYIHLAIQRRDPPLISDIINEQDLKAFLRQPALPQTGADNARTLIQVFGANTDAVFSEKEKSIGSNGAIIIRDFMKDNKWVKLGIGIDWGVTFGDKDFFNSISQNIGRFLTHDAAPRIKPYADMFVSLETHEHEDHLRGIARVAKFGYNVPPLVLNQHTHSVLKRMMGEEKVDPRRASAILENCHIVSIDKYKVPQDPAAIVTKTYGKTVIEQGWEKITSESEGRDKYFPLLTVYNADHPQTKTTVRVGPAGHSAHALMFQIDGVLYTGDYKLDQTLPEKFRTDFDWLARCRDTAAVHVQESTNANRPATFNATIAEVKENRKKILRAESKGRVLADMVGSNAIDMEMFCRAIGEVRKEKSEQTGLALKDESLPYKYILFAGTAIRNKYGDLNRSESFKQTMLREYGIKTLHVTSKQAKELLDSPQGQSYAVIMTGTQDEELSISHRVSRDLHDTIRLQSGDAIMRLQAPIPGDRRDDIRRAQNNRYRHDFGCRVYEAMEQAAKGAPIYSSSHASKADYDAMHKMTGDLQKLLNHGGPVQLKGMKQHMDDIGARAFIPDKQALYEVRRDTRSAEIAGETPEERVGYRDIRANPKEFFNGQRKQATLSRVKDRWTGPVAEQIYRFEHALAERDRRLRTHAPNMRGANTTQDFNDVAANTDFPPIGIFHPSITRPYYSGHKKIKTIIVEDSETTGVSPVHDLPTDISYVATAPESDKILRKKTIKFAIPRYRMPAPGALIVTGNEKPDNVHKGLGLRKFAARMLEVYRDWPKKITKDENATALVAGYRNVLYDDPLFMRVLGTALVADSMKPMAMSGNLQIDVFNLYTAMLALVPEKIAGVKDKDGHYVRRLSVACEANGITVDETRTHGSLYDAELTARLLHKLREADPDIFDQMVMNCDFSASRASPMIDHILGQNQHLNDNAPVFGYVDRRDRTCTPRMGALVTIDTRNNRASEAIVIDLAKADPHQLEQLSDEELLAAMNDKDGPFAVVKLNQSPCLFPPQLIYRDAKVRARAVGNLPKTTLLQRANALKHMRATGQNVGDAFMQRVQRLYADSTLSFNPEWTANRAANDGTFRTPAERIFSIFHVMNGINRVSNRHYKEAAELLRSVRITPEEFKPGFDAEVFWKAAIHKAKALSEKSGGKDPYIEDVRFMIEWLVDDINPKYLDPADARRINALKSSLLHGSESMPVETVEKFLRDLNAVEDDPEQFARIVGTTDADKARWEQLKETYLQYARSMQQGRKYAMTDEKREEVRQFRMAEEKYDRAAPYRTRKPRMG